MDVLDHERKVCKSTVNMWTLWVNLVRRLYSLIEDRPQETDAVTIDSRDSLGYYLNLYLRVSGLSQPSITAEDLQRTNEFLIKDWRNPRFYHQDREYSDDATRVSALYVLCKFIMKTSEEFAYKHQFFLLKFLVDKGVNQINLISTIWGISRELSANFPSDFLPESTRWIDACLYRLVSSDAREHLRVVFEQMYLSAAERQRKIDHVASEVDLPYPSYMEISSTRSDDSNLDTVFRDQELQMIAELNDEIDERDPANSRHGNRRRVPMIVARHMLRERWLLLPEEQTRSRLAIERLEREHLSRLARGIERAQRIRDRMEIPPNLPDVYVASRRNNILEPYRNLLDQVCQPLGSLTNLARFDQDQLAAVCRLYKIRGNVTLEQLCLRIRQKQRAIGHRNCENSVEVFDQEPLEEVPLPFLIKLDDNCFNIINLVVDRGQNTNLNPYTRLPYTAAQVDQIAAQIRDLEMVINN